MLLGSKSFSNVNTLCLNSRMQPLALTKTERMLMSVHSMLIPFHVADSNIPQRTLLFNFQYIAFPNNEWRYLAQIYFYSVHRFCSISEKRLVPVLCLNVGVSMMQKGSLRISLEA